MTYSLAALCVGAVAAQFCEAGEGLLREVWKRRHPQKAQQLEQARQHLRSLADMCGKTDVGSAALRSDPMKWLRAHPEVAYALADEELARRPEGDRRQAVLLLTRTLGRKELGNYLPPLLRTAITNTEKLAVIRTMAALGDTTSLNALESLLKQSSPDADEEVSAAAVRGLGLSADERYLPLIQRVRASFNSDRAHLSGARAAYRCGASDAMQEIARFLRLPDNSEDVTALKDEAMEFMTQHFNERLVAPLADLILRTDNEKVAVQAMRSLIAGTGYAAPDPQTLSAPAAQPSPKDLYDPRKPDTEQSPASDGLGPPAAASPRGIPPDLGVLTPGQRQELVDKIVQWWHKKGELEFHRRRKLQEETPS